METKYPKGITGDSDLGNLRSPDVKKEILGINKSSMNILIHEKKDDLPIYIALHIFTRINIEKGILPIAKFHLFNK
jgi:hypothetical protein